MSAVQVINKYIKDKDITIYKLSKSTGISYELLRRTLNGTRKLTADELIKIAAALDYDLNSLKHNIL